MSRGRTVRWRYLRLWAELIGLSWRVHPWRTAALLAVNLLSAVIVAAVALALRAVIDGVIAGDVARAQIGALGAALAIATSTALIGVSRSLQFLIIEPVGLLHLEPRIQRAVASLDGLEHLERSDFQDRITLLDGASWSLMRGAVTAVEVVFAVARLVLLLLLLGTVSLWLLLLVGFAGLPLWLDQRGQRAAARAETGTAEAFRLQRHLFALATEASPGADIRVAGAGAELVRRQRAAWDEVVRGRLRARLRAAGLNIAGWGLFGAGFVGGLVLVIERAASGRASIGDVVLTITIAVALRQSIQLAVGRAGEAVRSSQVIEPYLWLREYVAAHAVPHADRPAPEVLRHGITLDRVTFSYPGTDRPALAEVSCHLPAGSVVAIVGEYGSGKTSLVKLLFRLYTPDRGTILVDGVPLSELDVAGWRERTSAAFQDFGRFPIRFAETVGLGDLPRLDDRARVTEAVEAADALRLVDKLPDGIDTQLGRVFEGVELSEGQWQKTALARASMRQDPLLFVLDEPTASLDAPSEHAILERYMLRARELAGRTGAITVVVSHRFSTVTGADQILVLEAGRLAESGTHDSLMALGGRYARLYDIQATAYSSAP